MQDRYSLRFESGERKGELVPISAARFTVGRRPGNSLVITDASVSGKHAELVVDPGGELSVRDLGSTNGTRVGTDKVTEQRLAHGDRLVFGSIELIVADAQLAGASAAAAGSSSDSEDGGMLEISADMVAKSGKKSRAGLLFGVAALLALGGVGYTLLGSGSATKKRTRPVQPVEGNLLSSGFSFESAEDDDADDEGGWVGDDQAPGSFLRSASARRSGQVGMEAELEPGEWAGLISPRVAAREGQLLELSAALRSHDGVAGRVGIEFLRGEGPEAPGPLFYASAFRGVGEGSEFDLVQLSAAAPPACTGARVRVEARAGGAVAGTLDVDDISVVTRSSSIQALHQEGEFRVFGLGEPLNSLAIYKVNRPLIGDLYLHAATQGSVPETVGLQTEEQAGKNRLLVRFDDSRPDAILSLRVEPDAAGGGIATMGPTGYRVHGVEFEREDTSALLLGEQGDLVALRFDPPVSITSVGQGSGARVHVQLGAARSFEAQIDFDAERARAGDIAHAARGAERDGEVGKSLAAWEELLANFPFEEGLVAEAETARARLVQAGLARLNEARVAFERASFFRLLDLYQLSRAVALEVQASYEGTEVADQADELLTEIAGGLDLLEQELDQDEVQRLQSIKAFLQASGSERLAGEVTNYLSDEYGVTQ